MTRIKADFVYKPQATDITTPLAEAFAQRRGVCQDFAHIMIGGLRGLGLPAAYVSGYLRTVPPAGKPRLQGADATHAWVSVWTGAHDGWTGFDPTNGRPDQYRSYQASPSAAISRMFRRFMAFSSGLARTSCASRSTSFPRRPKPPKILAWNERGAASLSAIQTIRGFYAAFRMPGLQASRSISRTRPARAAAGSSAIWRRIRR